MDYTIQTKWYEDLPLLLLFASGVFSILFSIYAMCLSALACAGEYSFLAIVIFWLTVTVAVALSMFDWWTTGLFFYSCAMPFVAFCMWLLERQRKRNEKIQETKITEE